jgi:hypothetical protein
MTKTAHSTPLRFSHAAIFVLSLALGLTFNVAQGLAATPSGQTSEVHRNGSLPRQGKIVIHSGLAWMNKTAPAFQTMARGLEKELASLGLTVVPYAKPSKLEEMPKTPLPSNVNSPAPGTTPKKPVSQGQGTNGEAAQKKADALGKEGKLPKLKLRSYNTPGRDADLPQSVKDLRPPDVSKALFAKSQELGRPVVQNFVIPGRIPAELESDASYADYALVVRFASVRSWGALREQHRQEYFMGLPGTLVAAAPSDTGPARVPVILRSSEHLRHFRRVYTRI